MKKLLFLALAAAFTIGLSSCETGKKDQKDGTEQTDERTERRW